MLDVRRSMFTRRVYMLWRSIKNLPFGPRADRKRSEALGNARRFRLRPVVDLQVDVYRTVRPECVCLRGGLGAVWRL
jgi:hypothetical protein